MRNSSKGPVHRPGGFTLLEVILAVSIILMVIGLGLVYRFNSQEKELLRKTSIKIEAMASRGHAMSVLHQKPFWLRIEHDKVVLAGADVRSQDLVNVDTPAGLTEDGEFSESNEEIYDTLESGGAAVALRRWGTQEDAWDVMLLEEARKQLHTTRYVEIESQQSWIRQSQVRRGRKM